MFRMVGSMAKNNVENVIRKITNSFGTWKFLKIKFTLMNFINLVFAIFS